MTELTTATLDTPLGPFTLVAGDAGLTHVLLSESPKLQPGGASPTAATGEDRERGRSHLDAAVAALRDYFRSGRHHFDDLILAPQGTPFQRAVWSALREIPYGATCSYGELARRVGRPGGARAVGAANRENPLGVIVPCHRVIAADGGLGGYAGGLERKRWLLAHEGALSGRLFAA